MTSDIAKRQRTVPSAKAFEFIWKRPVPEVLQTGEHFDRYDEDSQQLELSQISDVRSGTKPKKSNIELVNIRSYIYGSYLLNFKWLSMDRLLSNLL
ncbi:uncharacterized protein DC041_0006712 [Schistosoma bovis]|uniref:Uncharacterized protein n=1 Tax=Schistosoma bovis TaxID=6184 RepID=A0A430QFH7_SCHBO|nr:uncharacterized protein DC041_0006712 [Schistosoma bovis]